MAVFRRRRQSGPDGELPGGPADDSFDDDLHPEDRALEDAELLAELQQQESAAARTPPARPSGPWDVADAPAPAEGMTMLDLGGLLVPVPADTEVRVDMSPDGEVVAATLVQGDSQLQVNAFAAPRTQGIWEEVREEIRAALAEGGGQAELADGPYGPELRAQVPTELPDHTVGLAPARFLGVDGPRWFLRALVTGRAALDPEPAAPLEAALRQVVVVRGGDPMAVRDPLPLRLPPEVAEQAAAAQVEGLAAGEEGGGGEVLELPERGPEITERR